MLRKLYVMIGGCMLAASAYGQQDPQLSLFPFAPTFYNPAAAGSEDVTRIQLIHRSQWIGYQPTVGSGGAPSTQLLTASVPLTRINSGVGLYVFNDQTGPISSQAVQLAYAYKLPLKSGTLAFGAQVGLFNKRIDYSNIIIREPEQLPNTGQFSQIQPDISAGVYYNTVDYWVGASLFHINSTGFDLGVDRTLNALSRTAFLSAGYRLGLTYEIDLQPSILYKYTAEKGGAASIIDANLLATYNSRYFAGISYRQQDALTAMVGLNMLTNNALRLGFAYDIVTFGSFGKSPSSVEVMASYALPAPNTSKKPIIRTPRFRY